MKDLAQGFLGDAFAGIADTDEDEVIIGGGFDTDLAAGGHGFAGVLNDIKKDLFNLVPVAEDRWDIMGDRDIDIEAGAFEFGAEEFEGFLEGLDDIEFGKVWGLGADSFEEVGDDTVEAFDLGGADIDRAFEFMGVWDRCGLTDGTAEHLEVDIEGIEGVAEFVGDAGCEVDDGLNALVLDFAAGLFLIAGDIGDNDGEADGAVLVEDIEGVEGDEVDADDTALGVGQFKFAGKVIGVGEDPGGRDIEGAGQFRHRAPEEGIEQVLFAEAEEFAGGGIGVLDGAIVLDNEDAFAERGEHLGKHTALAGEASDQVSA